jgi:hypothetical protein
MIDIVSDEVTEKFIELVTTGGYIDDPLHAVKSLSQINSIPYHQAVIDLLPTCQEFTNISPEDVLFEQSRSGKWETWPAIKEAVEDGLTCTSICDDSLLGNYTRQICGAVRFPIETAFLHGMAVVGSAMTRHFKYEIYGREDNPVNLYTVSAQPPSSGKSAVNDFFTKPVWAAYTELNKANAIERMEIEEQLDDLAAEKKQATNTQEKDEINRTMAELQQRYGETPIYRYSVDDITPESMEAMAGQQNGMVNVISDESDVVNIVLGGVYSGEKKTNNSIFLKMFDGGWQSSARITRKGYNGSVYGTFAVLAQDESVKSILQAGQLGRGISERFLIMREPNILGKRDFTKYQAVDPETQRAYLGLVHNLVNADKTILRFDMEAINKINEYRNGIEKGLGDGGEYSNSMLRGALGKADKQICKIASVLHGVENYQLSSQGPSNVETSTVERAIAMYDQLKDAYIYATDSQGFAGDGAAIGLIADKLRKMADEGNHITTIRKIYKRVEKSPLFKNSSSPTRYIKDTCLPKMIRQGYIAVNGDKVYINPRINDSA